MEEQSEAEIEAAKAQARKEGTSNLFEDVVDVAPSESGPEVPQTAKTVKSKAFGKAVEEARPDFVRELIHLSNDFILTWDRAAQILDRELQNFSPKTEHAWTADSW